MLSWTCPQQMCLQIQHWYNYYSAPPTGLCIDVLSMARFSTQGFHSGILWTQKLRSPVENLELTSRFPQWIPTKNTYQNVSLCIDIGLKSGLKIALYFVLRWPSVVDGMLKFKNCAGAEDLQGVDSEHDRLLVNSQCSEHCRQWRVQTENDPLNSTHVPWTLQTLNWHWTL